MNENTKALADEAADTLPVGFGFSLILNIATIAYYGYEAWKACHKTGLPFASEPDMVTRSVPILIQSQVQGDGQSYAPPFFRKARHQIHRAERHCKTHLTLDQRNVLTSHMLNKAATADEGKVFACLSESPDLEGFPDDE